MGNYFIVQPRGTETVQIQQFGFFFFFFCCESSPWLDFSRKIKVGLPEAPICALTPVPLESVKLPLILGRGRSTLKKKHIKFCISASLARGDTFSCLFITIAFSSGENSLFSFLSLRFHLDLWHLLIFECLNNATPIKAVSLGKTAEQNGAQLHSLAHHSPITPSTPLWGKEMLLSPFAGGEETFGCCGCDCDCTEVLEKAEI